MLAREASLGRLDLFEHTPATLEIIPSLLGQREMARRARDETGTRVLFERQELPAHCRQRHAKPAPRRGKASGIGNGREHAHRAQTVHSNLPKIERNTLRIAVYS